MGIKKRVRWLWAGFILWTTCLGAQDTIITPVDDPAALIQALLGDTYMNEILVVAGSETVIGDVHQQGTFDTVNGCRAADFDHGVVLSTGSAADLAGPNERTNTGTALATAGDPCLNAVPGVGTTMDANVLGFRFTIDPSVDPAADTLLPGPRASRR